MPWLVALAAILGGALGPVLHHVGARAAVRAPRDGVAPRCEACAARRRAGRWHAIRCPACTEPIRRLEPWMWVLSAATFAGAAVVAGWSWLLPSHLVLAGITTVLMVTDLDAKLIPNRILYPGTATGLALLAAGAVLEERQAGLVQAAIAAAGYFVALLVVALVARGGFGMGDVKLAVLLGAFLGFWGWRTLADGVLLTGLLGGLPAAYLLITRKADRGHEIPYGPPMMLGAWLALVL